MKTGKKLIIYKVKEIVMTINRVSTTIRNVIESDFDDIIELLIHRIELGLIDKEQANISLAIAFKLWDGVKINERYPVTDKQRYIMPSFDMIELEYVYEYFK